MQTVIKVLGIIALIWIGFIVLGWVLGAVVKLFLAAVVIGVVLLAGAAGYAAIKARSEGKALR